MDFALSEEQSQIRESVRAFLASRYPFEFRRRTSMSEPGFSPEIWRALAVDLGLLGLPLAGADGGLDGDPIVAMVLMEVFGEALLLEPFLETAIVCGGLLRATGSAAARTELERIAAGDSRLAFAWNEPQARYAWQTPSTMVRPEGREWKLDGQKSVVSAAPWATGFVVTATSDVGPCLLLVDATLPGITLHPYPTIDGRRAADLVFVDVRLPAAAMLGDAGTALCHIERAIDTAIAAVSAEAVGVLRKLLHDTIAYTKERRQFGKPIAEFQALQHRMVDMYMQIEMAESATYLATLSLDADPVARAKAASAAKVTVGRACRFVGQNAVQLHGGMGMTDELAIGHYFKRATAIELEFGTVDHHLGRYTDLQRAA